MKLSRLVMGFSLAVSFSFAQAATGVDTVQYPTGYFLKDNADRFDAPYSRWHGEDWGWTHNAIAGPISTATLNIGAFDVDVPFQRDDIYALDSGTWTLLGSLTGADEKWSYTTFNLGSSFYDDIHSGLQVRIGIDVDNNGYGVTLVNSTLSIDGGALPPLPTPQVPEPETYAMMLAGLGLLLSLAKRRSGRV